MRSLALVLVTTLAAPPAMAEAPSTMTAEEREAFRAEVRAYLLENPEVLVEAMDILEARENAAAAARDAELVKAKATVLFSSRSDWVGGNPDGDITVVEFMDYRCSYCRKAHDEVASLVSEDGNIRYVIKEFPILGDASVISSQFAIAIRLLHGDAAYKAAHDALIALRGEPTVETLTRLAEKLGHEPAPIFAKMSTKEVIAVIAANHELAESMAIAGTPTFVVEDVMLRGYAPLKDMQALVAELRAGD